MWFIKLCYLCLYPKALEMLSRLGKGRVKEKWDKSSLQCLWGGSSVLCPWDRPWGKKDPQRVWGSESKANLVSQSFQLAEVLCAPQGEVEMSVCWGWQAQGCLAAFRASLSRRSSSIVQSNTDVALTSSRSEGGLAVRAGRSHQPWSGQSGQKKDISTNASVKEHERREPDKTNS